MFLISVNHSNSVLAATIVLIFHCLLGTCRIVRLAQISMMVLYGSHFHSQTIHVEAIAVKGRPKVTACVDEWSLKLIQFVKGSTMLDIL